MYDTVDFIYRFFIVVYTHLLEIIYLSLSAQLAVHKYLFR